MSHQLLICAIDPLKNVEAAVAEQMQPFDENGDWFKDGTRWDWYVIGGRYSGFRGLLPTDTVRRGDLNKEELERSAARRATELWNKYQAETDKSGFVQMIYGLTEKDTLETVIARRKSGPLNAGVFLRGRRWHENERLGWFGCSAETECEAVGRSKGKCIVGKVDKPPCIIGFNEDPNHWNEHFFSRFIEPLSPETILVAVDYHV